MYKILYIYGYGSNSKDSSTMKVVKEVVNSLGYDLVSIEYDQNSPEDGLETLEKYINDNNIKILSSCFNTNITFRNNDFIINNADDAPFGMIQEVLMERLPYRNLSILLR